MPSHSLPAHPCRFNTTSIVTTFQGYLQLPSPATLTLFLQSSDGSEMYLDWRNTCEPLECHPGAEPPWGVACRTNCVAAAAPTGPGSPMCCCTPLPAAGRASALHVS